MRRVGGFPFPSVSPVKSIRCLKVLSEWDEARLALPAEVLWAMGLNEGDLVMAELPYPESPYLCFENYLRWVRFVKEACEDPWLFAEELLRRPMAWIGRAGWLDLTGFDSRGLLEPGEPVFLDMDSVDKFDLCRAEERSSKRQGLSACATYSLRIEEDFQLILPEDVLWVLSLTEGSSLEGQVSFWSLKVGNGPVEGQRVHLEIGRGGTLSLPESLRRWPQLQPGSRVSFELWIGAEGGGFQFQPELCLERV